MASVTGSKRSALLVPQDEQRPQMGRALLFAGIIAMWLYGWAGNFILTFQLGRYVDETFRVVTRSTPLADITFRYTSAAAIVALMLAIVFSFTAPRTAPLWHLIALLAPWVVLYPLFLVTRDIDIARQDFLYPLLVSAIYFARPTVRQVGALIVVLATISAGASVAIGIVDSAAALMPPSWNVDKAIIGDESLAGLYGHSNQLGTILALSIPFVIALCKGRARGICLATIFVALLWSASRSSLASAAVFLLVVLLAKRAGSPQGRKASLAVMVSAIIGGVIMAIWLTLTTNDPAAYTNRGRLWMASVQLFRESPWLGWGPEIWTTRNRLTARLDQIPNSAHDLWMTFATTGGVPALAALVVAGVAITSRAAEMYRSGEVLPLSFLVMFVLLSIAEDPLRGLHAGPQSFIVWTGLALTFCDPPKTSSPIKPPHPSTLVASTA